MIVASLEGTIQPMVHARFEPICGVILVNGDNRPDKSDKRLSVLQNLIQEVSLAGSSPVIMVIPKDGLDDFSKIENKELKIIVNPDWQLGSSTSILTAMKNIPLKTGAVIFFDADLPFIGRNLLELLTNLWRTSFAAVVMPLVAGQRSNPVLFDRSTFNQFASLTGDQGVKTLTSKNKVEYLAWHDDQVRLRFDDDGQI